MKKGCFLCNEKLNNYQFCFDDLGDLPPGLNPVCVKLLSMIIDNTHNFFFNRARTLRSEELFH